MILDAIEEAKTKGSLIGDRTMKYIHENIDIKVALNHNKEKL